MIAAQLVARFPNGMTSLGILLHVEQQTGSYGAAGLVLAAASVGQAAAGPVTSRWMGAWGMRRVLTLTLTVCVAAVRPAEPPPHIEHDGRPPAAHQLIEFGGGGQQRSHAPTLPPNGRGRSAHPRSIQ